MIVLREEVCIDCISAVRGRGESLSELACKAASALSRREYGAVIAATFSNPRRFPALSVEIASALSLSASTPAFDLQLACSAYPYAVYLAAKIAADTGKPVLVVDGDVQTSLVDASDKATGNIFSDAASASVISVRPAQQSCSRFDFYSSASSSLECDANGPIRMDGFKVFSFVAREISAFLRPFGSDFDIFVPHQANGYMIRQLAKSLGHSDKLVVLEESVRNPGSCSIPLALAYVRRSGRALIAGFGAGFSAAAGVVRISDDFEGIIL